MKKWLVLILVLAGGAWGFQKWREAKPDPVTPGTYTRPTNAVVEVRNIEFSVNAAGDIGPAEQVSVRPEINGKINALPVDIGDAVKKNSILFTLDDTDLQTQRSSQVTEVDAAKLQLDKAKRNFERSKELYDGHLVSLEVFQDSRTDYELAQNTLDRAQKALHLVEYQLTKTKILAPFDCTVLTRPVSIGQAVSGSGGFNSGTEVLTIADLTKMVVNAHINQADVTRLSAGQEVVIQVESVPGLTMQGTIERIAPQATIKNAIRGYDARVFIKIIDPRVRPGMTSNLSIPLGSANQVLSVPLAAVYTEQDPDTKEMMRFVYVRKDGKYDRRPVQVGVTDYDYAEIRKGLAAGEVVALEQPPGEAPPQILSRGLPADRSMLAGQRLPNTAGGSPAATSKPGAAGTPAKSSGVATNDAKSGSSGGVKGPATGGSPTQRPNTAGGR